MCCLLTIPPFIADVHFRTHFDAYGVTMQTSGLNGCAAYAIMTMRRTVLFCAGIAEGVQRTLFIFGGVKNDAETKNLD